MSALGGLLPYVGRNQEVTRMAIAILQLGDVELRTTDSLTCRTLFRLMNTAVRDEELDDMVDAPRAQQIPDA